MVEVTSALASLRKLISLKLYFCYHNHDKSLEAIVNSVLKMNQIRLLSLNFGQSRMTSQGVVSIGKTISKLHDLENLTLRFRYCKNIKDNSEKVYVKV